MTRGKLALPGIVCVSLVAAGCGGSGDAGSCAKVQPCGGSVVGTWDITTSCGDALAFSSSISQELSNALGCTTTVVKSSGAQVTGSLSFNADSTYQDRVLESGSATLHLESACLTQNGSTLTCAQADLAFVHSQGKISGAVSFVCADTNGGCDCVLGFGPQGQGAATSYTVSGTTLTIDMIFFNVMVGYCVDGTTLHLLTMEHGPATDGGSVPIITGEVVARQM